MHTYAGLTPNAFAICFIVMPVLRNRACPAIGQKRIALWAVIHVFHKNASHVIRIARSSTVMLDFAFAAPYSEAILGVP